MAPKHGWWCNTRTFPTVCKFCSDRVFYFSCDCGSAVFFDKLGPPWPIHRCNGFVAKPTLSQLGPDDLSGSLLRYLDEGVAETISRLIEERIERDYVEAIQQAVKDKAPAATQSPWITRQDSYHDCRTTERGTITELIRNANIFKKAGVTAGSMGVAALGTYAVVPLVQITIHTLALAEDESDNCSFTFFIEQSVIEELSIVKGCVVVADLRGIEISRGFPIWVCDQLTDLY